VNPGLVVYGKRQPWKDREMGWLEQANAKVTWPTSFGTPRRRFSTSG
jgi:hypothetical protein